MNSPKPVSPAVLNMAVLNAPALTDAALSAAWDRARRDLTVALMNVYRSEMDRRIDGCETCTKYRGRMAPSHFASPRCESGRRSHCTCDTCF